MAPQENHPLFLGGVRRLARKRAGVDVNTCHVRFFYLLIPTEVELSGDDESLIHLTEKPIILPKLSRRAFRSS